MMYARKSSRFFAASSLTSRVTVRLFVGGSTGDSNKVCRSIDAFVPAFFASRKTRAMVTGHAHGYERFERQGKTFIVTGGGGGPRFPLLQGDEQRHGDDQFCGPALRHFNFVEFTVHDTGLHADAIGLPKGSRLFCRMDASDLTDLTVSLAGEKGPVPLHRRSHGELPACPRAAEEAACAEARARQ
jgi:hypothetical protein